MRIASRRAGGRAVIELCNLCAVCMQPASTNRLWAGGQTRLAHERGQPRLLGAAARFRVMPSEDQAHFGAEEPQMALG